jgi:hypothetical protein
MEEKEKLNNYNVLWQIVNFKVNFNSNCRIIERHHKVFSEIKFKTEAVRENVSYPEILNIVLKNRKI